MLDSFAASHYKRNGMLNSFKPWLRSAGEESNEEEDEEEGEQEAVPFPQPSSLRTILTRYLSLTSPLTYQAALALAR